VTLTEACQSMLHYLCAYPGMLLAGQLLKSVRNAHKPAGFAQQCRNQQCSDFSLIQVLEFLMMITIFFYASLHQYKGFGRCC